MTTLLASALLVTQASNLTFVPTGMTSKMGGYMPVRAEMTSQSDAVKKAPADLRAPMYGTMVFGAKSFAFILDEPEGSPARLFVDTNGNGDLTDDPVATWQGRTTNGTTMHQGSAKVLISGQNATVNAYRFDKNDPARASLKNTLLYYGDFGYQGTLAVGNDSFKIMFAGDLGPNPRVWVDRNGNGKNDGRAETVMGPFNFGSGTYELKAEGGKLLAVQSQKSVDAIPLPPDLSVGAVVPPFEAVATDGTKISFPSSYKGKTVLLDFWAMWCGPCLAELPNLTKAYERFHSQGLEILGISLDQANQAEKLAAFTKERNMPWRQVYEGKYWDITIGKQYGVEGIPFALLVDGDTGKIIATVQSLRGEALEKTLSQALNKSGR